MDRVTLTAVAVLLLATPGLAGCVADLGEDLGTSSTPDGPVDVPEDGFTDTAVPGNEGEYVTNEDMDYSLVLDEGRFGFAEQELVTLGSEVDGQEIQVKIVRPDVPEDRKVPVVVHASPYYNPLENVDLRERQARLTENLVEHGFAVAAVAVRGTANSGGCSDLMGPRERADLDQAITHLGEAEWSNGNVGMIGVSYDGSTPWEVAGEGNPHLETIVPISGVNDIHHLMFRNGTTESRGPVLLNALYYAYGFYFDSPADGRTPQNTAEGVVCPEAYEGFAASLHSAYQGERDPFGYWEERNSRPKVEENYDGSIFMIQGLQDWNVDPGHQYPWINELEDQEIRVKHLLGQWFHAWPDGDYLQDDVRRYDFMEQILRWFEHELEGNESVDLGAEVQVQDSTGQWRTAEEWPPDGEEVTFHPTTEGGLARDDGGDAGTATIGVDTRRTNAAYLRPGSYAPDGTPCGGCAAFSTDAMNETFRIAGMPTFHAEVTPSAPGGNVGAFLYAGNSDSGYTRVGWGQIDLRFRDGGEEAQTVVPGETYTAKLQLEPMDAVVEKGEKLMLLVSQGSYGDHDSEPVGPMELHVGDGQSPLTVNEVEPIEDQFFTPPGWEPPATDDGGVSTAQPDADRSASPFVR
jgi:X-Pro dipeptidyl-peptidase